MSSLNSLSFASSIIGIRSDELTFSPVTLLRYSFLRKRLSPLLWAEVMRQLPGFSLSFCRNSMNDLFSLFSRSWNALLQ